MPRHLPLALLTLPLVARAADPPTLHWERCQRTLKLRLAPARGQHLSPDLPIRWSVTDGHITVREPGEQPPERGDWRRTLPLAARDRQAHWTLQVEGGVCDDDGASCVPFSIELELHRPGPTRGQRATDAGSLPESSPAVAGDHAPEPSPLEGALTAARTRGVPLVVDFSAHWCPPCQRLKAEVLEHPAWASERSRYEWLVLDADDPASFGTKDRYRVGAYPTVLVLDGEGVVLDRIVGYSGASDFVDRLRATQLHEGEAALRAAVEAGDIAARTRWVRRLQGRDDLPGAWEAAVQALPVETLPQADPALLSAAIDVGQALRREDPQAAATLPDMALALARRTVPPGAAALLAHTAVEAFRATNRGPEAEAAQREILPRLQPALEMARPEPTAPGGTARGLVQLAAPEVLDDRGNACMVAALWAGKGTAGAHDAALRAALQFAAAIVSETPPGALLRPAGGPPPAATIDLPASLLGSARSRLTTREGRVHDLLDALETAALHDVLGALLQALVEEVPDRFVWHHRKAAFHRDRGDLEAALEETRRATGAGFGDNRLRAAQRQAEILRDLGRRADALATVEDALSTPAPSEGAVRTHRYRAALESLRVQLLAAP